ncbi:MAG: maleylpyruvate isomerase family mycothiol-dependent enzyme [Aeromicrobium sp.]|uniref:maleylpyruvate isomerase family mycothiol-dependent enzyme n=1 Tax=Aeromicrobium sp. TaxID=1871063 RepID=UPI0039E2ACCD
MDHVLELGAAMQRYAELADAAFGTEAVPSCPGWTFDDLTLHLGSMHRWAGSILLSGQRLDDPVGVRVTQPASEWYAGTAAALLEILMAVDEDEPTPNFSRVDERAAFWARRQMHETTVHTVDACLALGLGVDGWPVPAQVAADGIDEVLSVFFARLTAQGRRPHLTGRVKITATDVGRSWIIAEAPDAMRTPVLAFARDETGVTGRIVGPAAQIYLALWGRIDNASVATEGLSARQLLRGPLVP